MKNKLAIIGTSNLDLGSLVERLHTRFMQFPVASPTTEEIQEFLVHRWATPIQLANRLAVGSGGNVRAALLDLEAYNNCQE